MDAIFRLAWLRESSGLVPVNWRDMETEELGSVYESLLELTPRLTDDGRGFAFAEGSETKGHARKTSGSYYTPDSLVQALLDSALDPVLDRVEAEANDPAAALLGVTVLDPACGSGHFLLAAARRIATRLARARAGGVAAPVDYPHALRDVARACIHGVDRNPMAVELTKVALWIETVEPGKPLGFLDANIRCGDSLLGVFDLKALEKGIPDDAYKPLSGDDKETARHFAARNKAERAGQGSLDFGGGGGRLPTAAPMAGDAKALRAMPEDDADQIAAKRERFEAARADPSRWNVRVAADLYVTAFLAPKTGGVPANRDTLTIPTTAHVWDALAGRSVFGPLIGRAQDLARTARAFHWPLEFPDVMAAGGFAVVLGNPPWEVMQLGEEEYFSTRLPEIAELAGAVRKRAIIALEKENPAAFEAYRFEKRRFEASNEFARSCDRFNLTARGKVNTYGLFAELFTNLMLPRGRAGLIVPSGIATDVTTAPFFAALLENKQLLQLVSFENEEFVFPAVHHSFRFCLLILGTGRDGGSPEFAFFLRQPSQRHDAERRFRLLATDIARINPNTKTAPVFRSRSDAELTEKIYRHMPVLIEDSKGKDGNPWGIEFRQGLFNMTSDSNHFRTAVELGKAGFVRDGVNWVSSGRLMPHRPAHPDRYVPLYEAKMTWIYDHRASSYHLRGDDRGHRVLPATSDQDHQNISFEPEPFYWVADTEVEARLRDKEWGSGYIFGWRDITTAVSERTMIPCMIPRVGCGDTFLIAFPNTGRRELCLLYANWASLPFDYVTRQKIAYVHLKYNIVKQLPVLPPTAYSISDFNFIVSRVLELTYTSHSMAAFARDLGHDGPPFAWNENRRAQLRAELDAWYARAYGLSRDELRYILDPADVKGADYPSETFRVLKKNEVARFGEYRTARLVLEAWDQQELDESKV